MKKSNKKRMGIAITYVLLVFVLLISLFPIVYPLFSAFRTDKEIFANMMPFTIHTLFPIKWTWENFTVIFQEYHFGTYIWNTLRMIALVVPGTIIICALAAYAFAFYDFKFKSLLFGLFLITFMIPGEAIAQPLYLLVNTMGLVNTTGGLVLPALANGLVLFLFVQFFSETPKELIESVEIDGGGWWVAFWKIVLPLAKPIIITACLMVFVDQWNNYLWPLLAARSDNVKTVTLAIANFKEQNVTHWSYIYAASMLSALIPICLFLPFQKYFVQGMTAGSVKG